MEIFILIIPLIMFLLSLCFILMVWQKVKAYFSSVRHNQEKTINILRDIAYPPVINIDNVPKEAIATAMKNISSGELVTYSKVNGVKNILQNDNNPDLQEAFFSNKNNYTTIGEEK